MNAFVPESPLRLEREVRNVVAGGLLFLFLLAGVSVIVLRNVARWGEREEVARFSDVTRAVALRSERSPDPAYVFTSDHRFAEFLLSAGARSAAIYDRSGHRVAAAEYLLGASEAPGNLEASERPRAGSAVTSEEQGPSRLVLMTELEDGRILRVGFEASALSEARWYVRGVSVIVPLAAFVLSLLVFPFLRRLMRPLEVLDRKAREATDVVPHLSSTPEANVPDAADRAIAAFSHTIEELRRRTAELEEMRRREKERADVLAVTAETLVRSHPGGLIVIDANGMLTDANAPALEALSPTSEVIGVPAAPALSRFGPLADAVERAARGEPTLALEFVLGEAPAERRLAVTAVPIADAGKRPLGTLLFLEDRTTTSRLERELSVRRELAALGEMSAGIAHEFRNATATILGYARLAATTDETEARARHLAGIRDEAEHVARVTGDFLFFARPERLVLAEVELAPIVSELVDEEKMAAPDTEFTVAGEFPAVAVDAALFRRALVNLLRNAREAAGSGGRVLVRGECVRDGVIRLSVEDDGSGVPVEERSKLFVPFYSTKESGTGIGLALVAKIVALHGGTVNVDRSEELGGARFVVSIPAG